MTQELIPLELKELEPRKLEILAQVYDIPVETQSDYEKACEYETKLNGFIKAVEKVEKDTLAPIKARHKAEIKEVIETFSKFIDGVKELHAKLLSRNNQYQRDQLLLERTAQAEANRKAQAEFNKAASKGITPDIPVPVAEKVQEITKQVKTDAGTRTTLIRLLWKFANPKEADPATTSTPRIFMQFDTTKINRFVASKAWTKVKDLSPLEFTIREIPSIILYEDVGQQTRSK